MAVMEISFASASLKRWVDVTAIVPLEAAGVPDMGKPEKFPALYLLHGFSGNHKDWLTYSKIRTYAEKNNLAVIMPSGENCFYVDDEQADIRYGEFIKELVLFTRKMFPLSDKREETFIGGLSMGGFGALRNGLYYNELFGKIISLSGAYILDDIAGKDEDFQDAVASYGYYARVFGDLDKVKESDKNPVVCAVDAVESGCVPEVFMACGTEDFLNKANRKMCADLEDVGVKAEYYEGPGGHEWIFWDTWMEKAVKWLFK